LPPWQLINTQKKKKKKKNYITILDTPTCQ